MNELEKWLDKGGARHLRTYKIGGAWYVAAFDWSHDAQKQVKLFETCSGSDEATAREHLVEIMRDAKVFVNELAKEARDVLGTLNGLRGRLAGLDVPEDFDHLQSNALDGLYSAVGYLETLASRAERNED